MSIYKTKSGKYRAEVWQDGVRVAVSPLIETKDLARTWKAEYKRRAIHGELGIHDHEVSVLDALAAYAEQLKGSSSKKHLRESLSTIGRFIDGNGIRTPGDIQADQIKAVIAGKNYSSCYAGRMIQLIKAFMKFMHQQGYLKNDVSVTVKKPRMRNRTEPRVLTPEELQSIFASVEKHASILLPFVKFLALSGFRKLEAVALEWSDVDFENRTVSIKDKPHLTLDSRPFRCKWGSARTLPMSEDLASLLAHLPKVSSFVFPGPSGGNLNKALRRFSSTLDLAGIERPEEVDLHSFRHTWVTGLVRAGIDIYSVMRYAGHKNLSTTQRYLHGGSDQERMKLDASRFPKISPHRPHTQGSEAP